MTKKITITLTVRIGDINYGAHLAHDKLITLLHQARCDYLSALDASELDCQGVGLILRHLEVDYRAEGKLNDVLDITMWAEDIRASRFTLVYQVMREDKLLAEAKTEMVGFDYSEHKVAMIPEAFRQLME